MSFGEAGEGTSEGTSEGMGKFVNNAEMGRGGKVNKQ